MSREQLLQGLNGLVFVIFTSWAFFQYNDPDGPLWMVIYGSAAVSCVLFLYDRLADIPSMYPILLLGVYLATQLAGEPVWIENGIPVEVAREMIGSFIVAGWMAFLARKAARRNPPVSSEVVK